MTVKQSKWRSLSQEEKQKILDRQYALKDRTRKGLWKDRPHWTETASPEKLAEWKAKVKAGRDAFYEGRTKGKGRPKKFNYKKGWNPENKSRATSAMWAKMKVEDPERFAWVVKRRMDALHKKYEKTQPLRDEKRWAEENKVKKLVDDEIKKEQDRLYEIAKSVLTESGIEPEKNQPVEYYKEIINFFKPGTV